MQVKQLLLTTDFSDHARGAYHCAAHLAAKCGASLHLVHFAGAIPSLVPSSASRSLFEALEIALVDEINSHAAFEGVDVQPRLQRHRWTQRRQRSLERELDIDLIVMSPQGRTGLARILFGSFADRVVRHSSVPVLIFRPTEQSQTLVPRTVLVPHDFHDRPKAVLPAMRWLNIHFNSTFRFLHVYDPDWTNAFSIRGLEEQISQVMRNYQALSVEQRFAIYTDDELGGIDVTLETAQGFPSQQVVQRSNHLPADLVLLGKRDGLGSVSRSVIREARCSVLAMPMNMRWGRHPA